METIEPVPGLPGATIRRVASLPSELPDSVAAGPHAFAKPGQLLAVVPGTGRFFARSGETIEFTVDEDADQGMVSLILNGTARGALIHQRGELPLHAATLVPQDGGKALAICGRSGAGKSTLAAELTRRGWNLVADDTTRVTWDGGAALAWPSRDSIKLWKDALDSAGVDPSGLERVLRDADKFYLQVKAVDRPVPLGSIIELTPDVEADQLSLGDMMALVSRNTYRPAQIGALGMEHEHVRIVARTVGVCRMWRVKGDRTRPVAEMAEGILRMIA
ncbi:MAG: hypothetical protein JSR60_13695 [Proteobacteria bacterium]|nr:hypothetical protein [Pseudomonadota bacterium]